MRLASVISASCETFLPCLCLHCGEPVAGDRVGLCETCWTTVIPQSGSACPRCGTRCDDPLEICLACQAELPPQTATVLWGEYGGALRSAILAVKRRGHDAVAIPLARRLVARIGSEDWAEAIDTVTHVPSHAVRRLRKGWPAAACLALQVARELSLDHVSLLSRRGLDRQTGRSRAQRMSMPRRSFRCRSTLDGHAVLLIDDVVTTGTTFRRSAEALLEAGADSVRCAAMAATPDARRMT